MIFVATFGALTLVTVEVTERASDTQGDFEPEVSASRLADTIFGEPGASWYSSLQCTDGEPNSALLTPDAVTRFGLGAEDCPDTDQPDALVLSLDKMRDLSKGSVDSNSTNDHVDYEEARKSLQLDLSNQQFHLRSWPLLPDLVRNMDLDYEDPNVRAAYLGGYDTIVNGVPTSFVVNKVCGKTVNGSTVDLWVDINNNGTASAAFEVVFSIPLSAHTIELRRHTAPVIAMNTQRVTATITKTADWEWAGTPEVTVSISDTMRSLGSCTISLSGVTMTAGSTTPIYTAKAEHLETTQLGPTNVKVYYDAYTGEGSKVGVSGWTLALETSLGVPLASDSNLNNRGWESFSLATPGTHVIKLKSSGGSVLDQNSLNLLAVAISPFTPLGAGSISYQPGSAVVPEASFLAALVSDFDPHVYSILYNHADLLYQAGGDVYPVVYDSIASEVAPKLIDNKGTIDPTDDVPTLANYNTLIVGSTAVHSGLNSVAFKNALEDWVGAGGLLIVFGSNAQTEYWLEPIFFSALSTAGSGLSAPDPAHPILHSPNSLDFTSYDTGSVAWSFTHGEDADHFTHIIETGDGDALALSEPGTVGDGTVLVTSFQPWDLQGTGSTGVCNPAALQGSCEALRFMHNLVTLAYRELYLDFGPELPMNERVASVTRLAILPHRDLDSDVEIIIQLHVF